MSEPTPKNPGGRPRKPASERKVAVHITLTPSAVAKLDATGGARSDVIERLIMKASVACG